VQDHAACGRTRHGKYKHSKITVKILAGLATGQQLRPGRVGEFGGQRRRIHPGQPLRASSTCRNYGSIFRRRDASIALRDHVNFSTSWRSAANRGEHSRAAERGKSPEGTRDGNDVRAARQGQLPRLERPDAATLLDPGQVITRRELYKGTTEAIESLAKSLRGRRVQAATATREQDERNAVRCCALRR